MPSSLEKLLGIGRTTSAMKRSLKKKQDAALEAHKQIMSKMRMGDSPNTFNDNQEATKNKAIEAFNAMRTGTTKKGGRSRKSKSRKRGRTHKRK